MCSHSRIIFEMLQLPPTSTLFPYTTLFRSGRFRPRRRSPERACLWRIFPCRRIIHAGVQGESVAKEERRSEEHTSELQSPVHLVCRLLLEKKKIFNNLEFCIPPSVIRNCSL